jgi:phospholipase C
MKMLPLSLLTFVFVTAAAAQFNLPVQHVIIVVQENRTVNNLFANDPNLSGVNFFTVGECGVGSSSSSLSSQPLEQAITLTPYQLDACFDASHLHTAWETSYDSGALDGFCQIPSGISNCTAQQQAGIPTCIVNGQTIPCPQYTTVKASQIGTYFQIAANGGFANYMFQTNQGPSFPAHQFLFTGTSEPIAPTTEFYRWFAAENATFPTGDTSGKYGCIADSLTYVLEVNPDTGAESQGFTPPYVDPEDQNPGYPCYSHNTMVDVLKRATPNVSWRYYTTGTNLAGDGSLWNAPNAIDKVCVPSGPNGNPPNVCTGGDYTSNVVNNLQLFTDLGANPNSPQCTLPHVSWVIPSGAWSDHPGTVGSDGGPSWVAAIVNAVGGFNNDGTPLPADCGYWGNTVILTTWDDWGGFYDGVNPVAMSSGNSGSLGFPGTSNGTFYVYGFRVPLLVTSTFAKIGYVSGNNVNTPDCPADYCHDFGSILNFVEYAFGSGGTSLGEICSGCGGGWHYSDFYAQDQGTAGYSLHDFFNFQKTNPFVQVTGAKYATSCFITQAAAEGCFSTFTTDPTDSD